MSSATAVTVDDHSAIDAALVLLSILPASAIVEAVEDDATVWRAR